MNTNDQIEISELFEDVAPMGSKRVAVIIGRFNPPTRGHYSVINSVKKFIKSNKKLGLEVNPVVMVIGGSKSDADKKRNPLTVDERILFMTSSGQADGVKFFSASNAFAALSSLREQGYEPLAVAAGSDRIADYIKILDKYFLTDDGQPIKHYEIRLERDADAVETDKSEKQRAMDNILAKAHDGRSIDVDAISGSLARRAVELGYEPEFAEIVGLQSKPALAKKMFDKIKSSISE